MATRFEGQRVLVTDAAEFMGPGVCAMFAEEGASVIAEKRDLTRAGAVEVAVEEAGHIDILIANLAVPYIIAAAHEAEEENLSEALNRLVLPLQRLVRRVLPQMMERRRGKIVVVGSASALRGMPMRSCYAAARGAQLAFVKTVALEAIQYNVHVNATAHAYIQNPTYYPPEYQQTEDFKQRMQLLPIGRLATPREGASVVLYLASSEADFMVGQVIPCAGGFVQ